MRLPNTAHTSRPWRIHELTTDFHLEDVWALPTPGGPDDFPLLVQGFAAGDPTQGGSRAVRLLWAIRWKVGGVLGWDDLQADSGSRLPTLRDRVPEDLRNAPGPEFEGLPFSPLYMMDDEFAAEIVNKTVHGVMHLSWVADETGDGYHGRMAVYVKPNGLLGKAYMATINPFRHLLVYPVAMRQIGRMWQEGMAERV